MTFAPALNTSARMPKSSLVKVGPYELQLPEFWGSGSVREKPGFFGYNAVAVEGVSFALNVLSGLGSDAAERARLVEALVNGYAPQRHTTEKSSFQGTVFESHRLDETEALGAGSVYELHLCEAYGDLLQLGFGFIKPLPQEQSLRHLFLTMVTGAIVRRGYAMHAR